MSKELKSKSRWLMVAIILSIIGCVLSLFVVLAINYNWGNVLEYLKGFYKDLSAQDFQSEIDYMVVNQEIMLVVNLIISIVYITKYSKLKKGIIHPAQVGSSLYMVSMFQAFFASILPAIFALVSAVKLSRMRGLAVEHYTPKSQKNPYVSDIKLQAMTESVNRLKALKESGAISEEEYYKSLDKILEG